METLLVFSLEVSYRASVSTLDSGTGDSNRDDWHYNLQIFIYEGLWNCCVRPSRVDTVSSPVLYCHPRAGPQTPELPGSVPGTRACPRPPDPAGPPAGGHTTRGWVSVRPECLPVTPILHASGKHKASFIIHNNPSEGTGDLINSHLGDNG